MTRDLTRFEPIPQPDVQAPAKLTSLPQWLEELIGLLRMEEQAGPDGRYRRTPVLPKERLVNSTQASSISKHVVALGDLMRMTPEMDRAHSQQAAMAIGKMLLTLPSKESGELAVEVKSEAYMMALDDVPFWATQAAMRRWYRGECGEKHDYRWQPAPATLRSLALDEVLRVKVTRRNIERLLEAEPLVEFDEDHCRRMREKLVAAGILPKKDAQ